MRPKFGVLVVGLGLLVSASPVFARHSFEAAYDSKKPVTLTGVVTKVEWTNSDARFHVDVKDESGKATNWNLELGKPNVLRIQGWKEDSLKVGDQVTAEGYLAKDGSKMADARKVTLAGGRKMSAGSSTRWASMMSSGLTLTSYRTAIGCN